MRGSLLPTHSRPLNGTLTWSRGDYQSHTPELTVYAYTLLRLQASLDHPKLTEIAYSNMYALRSARYRLLPEGAEEASQVVNVCIGRRRDSQPLCVSIKCACGVRPFGYCAPDDEHLV
jgi:hypothetical protein